MFSFSSLLTAAKLVLAFLGVIKKGEAIIIDAQQRQAGADAQTRTDISVQNDQVKTGAGIDEDVSKLSDSELDKKLGGGK